MEVPCLNLTLELMEQYANGTLHATVVQRIAAAAWADGWGLRGIELMRYMRDAVPNHRNLDDVRGEVSRAWNTESFDIDPMAKRLAFASTGNAERDITRAASPIMIGLPEPYHFDAADSPRPGEVQHSCYLVHETLHQVVEEMPRAAHDNDS